MEKRFMEAQEWPENVLKENSVYLQAFYKLCTKCERGIIVWQLRLLLEPDLDNWRTATGGNSPLSLRRFETLSKRIFGDLQILQKTPMVAALIHDGRVGNFDLLSPMCNLMERFEASMKLSKLVRANGSRAADFADILIELMNYIRHCHGHFMDHELQLVLDGLGRPMELKQFRYDTKRRKSKTKTKIPAA